MTVPEEVRKVERPKGTVVCDGKDGVYPVREKLSGTSYVDENGKRHRPSRNGRVVGHIIDMKFVEKDLIESVSTGDVDLKDWGNVEMFDRLCRDLLDLLEAHYNSRDAMMIYTMAILRASYRGIPDRQLQRQYEETFLTEMYPLINLGRSNVSKFLRNVGRTCSRITNVMRAMVMGVQEGDHVIIDGSLRQDHSRVNSISEVSRKTSLRGYKEVLLMYAYCMETKQPLCSKVYPGNMVDQRAVSDFLEEFGIEKGIIVADKGFLVKALRKALDENEGLHYLLPIRRNMTVIERLDLHTYDSRLEGEEGIQCKKVLDIDAEHETWYYSFRDPRFAADEEMLYMSQHRGEDFDPEDLESRRKDFGTIIFESDLDMECGTAYETYESRWLIELFFRRQEDTMEQDDTREHSDYSVIASNFIDYLSSIMVSRMLNFLGRNGLLDNNTYGDILNLMLRLKMTRVGEGEWRVRRIAEKDAILLEKTGLLIRPAVPKEVKKRGRPKGSKDSQPRKKRSKKGDPDLAS